MSETINGKIVDYFPQSGEILIMTDQGRMSLPIHLLDERQQHLAKVGQSISFRGKINGKKIVMVEGLASFD